jgi:hypothetical protein
MGGTTQSGGGKGTSQRLLDPGGFVWSPAGPDSPDFATAAERQAQSGRINTPFANWNGQNLEFQGGLGQGAQNLMAQVGSQGALPTGQEARDQAITSAYGQSTSRLDPMFAQREAQMRAQLANQGLDPGSQAADTATQNFGRERNDAYTQALANAIGQGTSAGNAIFQQGVSSQRLPYEQLGSLAGLLQGNQGRETQYLNAANMGYQGALNEFGVQQGGKNSNMGGAAQLGASLYASDERLKVNIDRSVLEAMPGVPFASWEWADGTPGRQFGVIAQDLEKVRPDLVHTDSTSGMKLVDYSFLKEMRHG